MAVLLASLLAVLLAEPLSGQDAPALAPGPPPPSFRLPDDVLPSNYTVRIVTHFQDDDFRFYGQMMVDFEALRNTSEIRLHSKDLKVDRPSVSLTPLEAPPGEPQQSAEVGNSVSGRSGRQAAGHYLHTSSDANFRGLNLANVSMQPEVEQLVIALDEPLSANSRYRLALRYWGTLNERDRGYFRGSYSYRNQTRYMSSTAFEPNQARRAFPCFDEPHLKASFSLVLGRHANYTSSANMPLSRTEPMEEKPGWFWDFYAPTPKMSTYLVAFMVHGLEAMSNNNASDGFPVRVLANPSRIQNSNFSLWLAPKVLSRLGDVLDMPAVMPKHDLAAVPGFRSSALENWGLVSFEERHLLLTPNSGELNKQAIATVVSHELAHDWFGNLITSAWWSDIWLNEGFATYYSAVAVDKIMPSWRFHEISAGNAFLLAMSEDSQDTSLPLIHPADNPKKLDSVFSPISYFKGYWMLRMLNHTLGSDVFDAGVRQYVQRHKYGSVSTADLWADLQEALDDSHALELEIIQTKAIDKAGVNKNDVNKNDIIKLDVNKNDVGGKKNQNNVDKKEVNENDAGKKGVKNDVGNSDNKNVDKQNIDKNNIDNRDVDKKIIDKINVKNDVGKGDINRKETDTKVIDKKEVDKNAEKDLDRKDVKDAFQKEIEDVADQEAVRRLKRARRDVGQVPLTHLALGSDAVDDSDERSSEVVDDEKKATPVPDSQQQPVVEGGGDADELGEKKAPSKPLKVAAEEVQSPPRRGPGASAFPGQVGWLPRPLEQIMKSWMNQAGFPLVRVYRNLDSGLVTVNQRRFLHKTGSGSASNATWWVPLHYTSSRGDSAVFWLPPTCGNVTLPVKLARDEWLLFNPGLSGMYRVRYDPRTLQQLSRLPRTDWLKMSSLTRLQLVSDSLELARQGRAAYQNVLQMANRLARDNHPLLWRAARPHFQMIERQLRGKRDSVAFRSWLLDLVSSHASHVGFTTRLQDSPLQASFRNELTAVACLADHSACQRKAKKALKQFAEGKPDSITTGPLMTIQLCAAVRWSGPAEWRFLRSQLHSELFSSPHRRAPLAALGCSKNQETLRSYLAEVVDTNSTLRRSDVAAVINAVAANAPDIALRFMEEQAVEMYHRLGDNPFRAEKLMTELASSLNSARQLEKFDGVLQQLRTLTRTRTPPVWGREVVRENIRWATRSRGDVSRWLRARFDEELRGTGSTRKPS